MQFILNYIFKLHIKIMLKESKKMWIIITILAVVSLCQAGAIARLMIDNHELKYRVDRVSAVRSSVLSYMIDT